jgi:NAD+ kinase
MHFPVIALVGKYHDRDIGEPLMHLAAHLRAQRREVLLDHDTAVNIGASGFPTAPLAGLGARADLVVVMGGDGTMLGAARQLAASGVPLLGINRGRLGFITDIALDRAREELDRVLAGEHSAEHRQLLQGRVLRGEAVLYDDVALNDIVVNAAGRGGLIELRVDVDGEWMINQRADGLIVATPTGSTAYALSANGPILHPRLRGLVLVPVAPQALSNRPITLPDDSQLVITLTRAPGGRQDPASVHFDMQTFSALREGDRIEVGLSRHTVCFLHPPGYSYFSTLRRKLLWNQMPTDPDTPA